MPYIGCADCTVPPIINTSLSCYTNTMGRYLEQTEGRSELQQKIAADLRAKAAARAKDEGASGETEGRPVVDGVEDSMYIKDTKTTTTLAPVWAVIAFAAVGVFIYFVYQVSR